MIIVGSVSGIQRFVFDINEEGGGQARRLRARSFLVQLLAESAALRVRRVLGWGQESVLLCGAGKFMLRGNDSGSADSLLTKEQHVINDKLREETQGELRLSLSWANNCGSDLADYQAAQLALHRMKAKPWAPIHANTWAASKLVLDPLNTPCKLCQHAMATEEEIDQDGKQRMICRTCNMNRVLGQKLPRAKWLSIQETDLSSKLSILGLGVDIETNDTRMNRPVTLLFANLSDPEAACPSWCSPDRYLQRRLMAHIPLHEDGQPVWFTELAEKYSHGDVLLAVLKADVDSLGVCFDQLLKQGGIEAMCKLSDRLDAFFAGRLREEMKDYSSRWWPIYTIFAGGDDLIMVGPWNVMVDFAMQVQKWFSEEFREYALTLSAGLELMKPKRPIKPTVERAESLLQDAKDAGKDRLAAFGQIWPWKDHETIIKQAKQLVEWTDSNVIQRGWLYTLLELALARHGDKPDPLATARLAYHVDRNWRKGTPARQWAEQLIRDFDDPKRTHILYLPASVRYALTATRAQNKED